MDDSNKIDANSLSTSIDSRKEKNPEEVSVKSKILCNSDDNVHKLSDLSFNESLEEVDLSVNVIFFYSRLDKVSFQFILQNGIDGIMY